MSQTTPADASLGTPIAQFDIKDLSGKQAVWKLLVYPHRLRLVPPADHVPLPYDVHRPEAADRIELMDAIVAPRMLNVKLSDASKKKTPFRLDPAAFAAVQDWLGYEPALRSALKHRMGWSITIGLLFVMASIPLGRRGDPNSIPFNPINLALGLTLLAIAASSKIKPHRNFFLLDACWMLILAAFTVHGLFRRGVGTWWYLVLVLQLLFVIGGIRQFRRFVRKSPAAEPVHSPA